MDEGGFLLGIVTNRDLRFESDMSRRVDSVMTRMPLVTAPVGTAADDAVALLAKHKIEKLPLVDADGRLKGLFTLKDFTKSEKYPLATKDGDGRLRVGAAIGLLRRRPGARHGAHRRRVDLLVVDTAHGHSSGVLDMIARLKKDPVAEHVDVVGGNVATREAAQALVDAAPTASRWAWGRARSARPVVAGVGVPRCRRSTTQRRPADRRCARHR